MQNLEDVFQTWCHGALVRIDDARGPVMIRPAAFVFAVPGGFSWVEPSYADPYGAPSPAWHERIGEFREYGNGFMFYAEDEHLSVHPFDPANPGNAGSAEPLKWFAEHLRESGKTWVAERERVRALVVTD